VKRPIVVYLHAGTPSSVVVDVEVVMVETSSLAVLRVPDHWLRSWHSGMHPPKLQNPLDSVESLGGRLDSLRHTHTRGTALYRTL
jgi:hypothetical protein